MKIKWKGKIAIGIMAILILINVSTLITTSDDPSGNNAEISAHIPPIDRGDNGVADIYIYLDPISSEKTHIETPEKIIVTPLSNGKKIKTLVFQDQDIHMENDKILVFQDRDMHVRNDNRVHLHPLNMPDCEKAEITIYLPNNKITRQAIVRQVPKLQKVIHVNSTKSDELPDGITLPDNVIQNMDGVAPLWGSIFASPPFPDGDCGVDGHTAAAAHVDPDTGDGGAFAGSHYYYFSGHTLRCITLILVITGLVL